MEAILNLKQVEMIGFKSFADPVKVTFVEGVNAIVGPNGCGKSNVADAVKWVLGEQSSKNLRGTNMQDVIFKGTAKRKSLSFCEVSLTFDNSNKIFNVPYDELIITRKLYKNGDSEYLLNNNTCRLKEINELLRESGINKSGYSIISQGMINKIVLSKPEDRRLIFEDAAGISKFKYKKIEAERRLERTKENLNQIGLILSEIDKHLGPLKAQSENAKIFLDLKEKLKDLEVNTYIYKYDNASQNKEIINSKVNAILEELDLRQIELNNAINQYDESFLEFNELDDKVNRLHTKEIECTVGIAKYSGENDLFRQKLNHLLEEEQRLEESINALKLEFNLYMDSNANNKKSVEIKTRKLDELKAATLDLSQKFEAISTELEIGENEVQETQRKIFESLSKMGDVKEQTGALNAEKNTYLENLNNYKATLKDLSDSYQNYKLSEEKSLNIIADFVDRKDKLSDELNLKIEKQNTLISELKFKENELSDLNSNILSFEHRYKILSEMQREMEGFSGSVKRLIKDASINNELKDKIVGVLVNLIKVPEIYQTAIEMALGNAVQNIVTENEENAKFLINYLKAKEYGRVTFLPINSVKPRFFDMRYNQLISANGCFGVASELIKYNDNLKNIILNLLGNTVIVNDINNAIYIAKQSNYSFRIVTLDGDIIATSGSITGGSKKSQITNLLSRDYEIEQIKRQTNKLLFEKQEAIKYIDSLNQQFNLFKIGLQENTNNIHNIEIELAKEEEIYNKYVSNSSDLENQINRKNTEIAKTSQILESIDKKLKEVESLDNTFHAEEKTINPNFSQFNSLKQKREEYNLNIMQNKIEIASLESENIALETEIFRLSEAQIKCENLIENYTQKLAEIKINIKDFTDKTNNKKSNDDVKCLTKQLENIKNELKNLENKKQNNQKILRSLEEDKMRLMTEVNKLQDRKNLQDQNLIKIDSDIEVLQNRVWEEYELTYDSALKYKTDMFDNKGAVAEISRIRKEINALGNINVNAIEDFKALEQRHGDLYGQAQDLIKAEEDIKQVIKELSDEMSERFLTEFNQINHNFGLVFKELFGGGNAKLELSDPNNLLESGIEIKAEPPEKKLNNTSLLSGGEQALVAISILFAILRHKPIPFCLLDEVEAPLDDTNVVRFVQYLKRYSNQTQFVIITHKKPTMEYSDALFGITMEEKGVSKVVSVQLSDAYKMIQNENKVG